MSGESGRAAHDELAIDPEMVAAMCRSFITSHVASTGAERVVLASPAASTPHSLPI